MTRRMTATEAKAQLLTLLDEAAHGEEVEITKHGRSVARIVPSGGSHGLKAKFTGVALSTADDEELFHTDAEWELS